MAYTTFNAKNHALYSSFALTHVDVDYVATIAQSLPSITQGVAGKLTYKGTAANVLSAITQGGAGKLIYQGTATQEFPAIIQTATATVSAPPSLLLDTYTGAAAAFSLRKLRTAYSGSAIRVRESDGDTEADIGFDSGGLDTTALLAHTGANDGFVVTWYDQSGNSEDHTQSTTTRQPQIVSSGSVITAGGKPAVLGSGGQELFGSISFTQPVHTFGVVKTGATAGGGVFGSTGGVDVRFGYYLAGAWRMYAGGSILTGSALSTSTMYLMTSILNGASSILRVNGSVDASGTDPGSDDSGTSTRLMSYSSVANGWDGHMLEFLVWDADKTSDQSGIESAINTYYSVY